MKNLLKIFTFCLFLLCATGHACEVPKEELIKVYVTSQNLLIEGNALLLIDEDEVVQVQSIAFDKAGLYVVMARDSIRDRTCPNGHPVYDVRGCQGCANVWCVYRCRCCSPWAKVNLE